MPNDWNNDWHYYPYIPLSAGVERGDFVGTFSVNINDNGATRAISGIPSFLGLKNDYKYLGCIEEDTLLVCNSDKSQGVYIDNNIDGHTFDVTTVNGKMFVGTTPPKDDAGWIGIKKLNLSNLCNFPLEVGTTSTTGYGDSYYNPAATSGLRGAFRLGYASYGDYAGSVCLYGNYAPSNALAHCGVALCEFMEAFSTEPSLAA